MGLAGLDLRLIDPRIDFRDQLTLFHGIADLHIDFFKLPRNLSTDIHVLFGFEFSLRRYDFLDIPTVDRNRMQGILLRLTGSHRVPIASPDDQYADGD